MKYSKLKELMQKGELDLGKLSDLHSKFVKELKTPSMSPNKNHQFSPKSPQDF
jgi:hypothetical protein